ncbi:MAG: Gfo/Idh/MocA family protein [Nitrososphaerales archaeon]
MSKIRVGMIGLGGVGTWGHLGGYLEIPSLAKIVAFCDKDETILNDRVGQYGGKAYLDYCDLLRDPEVDMVDICLPHHLHTSVAIDALNAGKNVLLEKPIATTLDGADKIIAAAKSQKVKFMIAENTRFVNAYEIAKQLVDEGFVGDVTLARTIAAGNETARLADSSQWIGKASLAGGGILLDAGVHSFYLFYWLLGKVKHVSAITSRYMSNLPSDVEDNVSGTLRFENGAIGNFSLSYTTDSPFTERLELYGTSGSLIVDMLSAHPVQLFSTKSSNANKMEPWKLVEDNFIGERTYGRAVWDEPFFEHSALSWKSASMRREVQHFVRCLIENQTPLVSGEDGRYAVELALKAYESARQRKEMDM